MIHFNAFAVEEVQKFPYGESMSPEQPAVDVLTLGQRLRHLRQRKGLTLAELGAVVGRAPSQLSLVENGRREPRLSLLQQLADALDVPMGELLGTAPPNRRAALEIAVERAQRGPLYASLQLPRVKVGKRLPSEVLEALAGLQAELERRVHEQAATPEEARRANTELRERMRSRENYYADIEQAAATLLDAVGYSGGPLSHHVISDLAGHLGYTLHHVRDLPHSTRSVIDQRHRRIYLPQTQTAGGHDPRGVVLQALGSVVLKHTDPESFADFLSQRVETNYLAAALLVPERQAVDFLTRAKGERNLAVQDLRDVFAVSYETAAHRFTNLATHHLAIPVHFMRVHENGTLYKAYENDGVNFPTDPTGAVEGQLACRNWASRVVFGVQDKFASYYQYTDNPRGTYWCTARTEPAAEGEFSITVGVPYVHSKWFRGRDTTERAESGCPDQTCCRAAPRELAERWSGYAWPSARAHSHLLAALPPGTFPGVDDTEVYSFLQRHSP
ncbi:MAG: helix-turn-helix domain-containing protein [Streptosporangiales bacterium]|nr:helix-turn-helix domain-containing protein [Streptosporangiales bacterium]